MKPQGVKICPQLSSRWFVDHGLWSLWCCVRIYFVCWDFSDQPLSCSLDQLFLCINPSSLYLNTVKYKCIVCQWWKLSHLVRPPSCVTSPAVWTELGACRYPAGSLSCPSLRPPAFAPCWWLKDRKGTLVFPFRVLVRGVCSCCPPHVCVRFASWCPGSILSVLCKWYVHNDRPTWHVLLQSDV